MPLDSEIFATVEKLVEYAELPAILLLAFDPLVHYVRALVRS